MQLTKHHGLGNDFLIALDPDASLTVDAATARHLCDRRRGIGADGLILARPDGEGAVARMTLWNADGSVAELSGNGLRCLGQALLRAGWADGDHVVVTDAGPRRVSIVERGDGDTDVLSVELGAARPIELPAELAAALPGAAPIGVDVGNPHVVLRVDDVATHDPAAIGPRVEAHFADGVNVHLVEVVDLSHVTMRIWERGAGVTEACGSGATAAAAALHAGGFVGASVEVAMPGGVATVEVGDPLVLSGPATYVAAIEVSG
ncbi:MAG: diaminopimelate epimerase [Actinomycetota bacterium]